MNVKIKALAQHLGVDEDHIFYSVSDTTKFYHEENEYNVLNHGEAYDETSVLIRDLVWTLSIPFLQKHSSSLKCISATHLETLQRDAGEECNELFRKSIDVWSYFVSETIREYRYAHFVGCGELEEEWVGDEIYFIWKES